MIQSKSEAGLRNTVMALAAVLAADAHAGDAPDRKTQLTIPGARCASSDLRIGCPNSFVLAATGADRAEAVRGGDEPASAAVPSLIPLDDGKDSDIPSLSLGAAEKPKGKDESSTPAIRGFIQQEVGYTYASPAHFSTTVLRAHLSSSGRWSDNLTWKASVRGEVDPIYAWGHFYPDPVRDDQRFYGLIGETYVDTTYKGWDLRLGRQNIVWGEMVGLFFADVVTAKDLRQFLLPSFDLIRIPQWAARGEYFLRGDSHLELVWVPVTSFDRIGKPGSEYYPVQGAAPPGFSNQFRDEVIPGRTLSDSNYGARFSTLIAGWDLSAFHYRSVDSAATFYREIIPTSPSTGTIIYTPRHDTINQTGGTMSKDLGETGILKAEMVFTSGRSFNVTNFSTPNGLVRKDTLDYAVGLDYSLPADTRLNLQLFQRVYFSHDRDMLQEQFETGVTALYNRKLTGRLEGEVLVIQSVNRYENLVRPRLIWKAQPNLRITGGIDIFNGPVTGVLGRFANRDRLYVEARYDF